MDLMGRLYMANKRVKWDKTPASNAFAQHIILISKRPTINGLLHKNNGYTSLQHERT